ncbi:MAG: S8 family serine peptidase [Candidatus Thermoplasmatota archaeon]|nr:S8 family serine peptidase [Candidatus Thermoplasmatota archaeon]
MKMVSIFVALAMIVPGVVLTQQLKAETPVGIDAQSGPTTYAWVNFGSSAGESVLKDIGANIVSLRPTGAYVKVTESQRNYLSTQFDLNDLPSRTIIDLAGQGITFDSQVGYDLPAELRKAGTNEYLVQFVAPTETAWNDGVQAVAGKILCEIDNNLVVVKMTESQRANVENLDYVQWVGAYEPGFKIAKNIPSTGTVKITVDGYPNANIPELMNALTALGATQVEDSNYGTVICYIDASAIPEVAKLDSAMQVWNLQEMKTLNNVGARISQASDLWVNTVSGLPSQIAGQGQIVHVQDTGIDATYRDFLFGPLGDRLENPDSTTDANGHGTHVSGTVGGNGYNMEAYLGLDNTNRIYNELATSNPANRPDRSGFAGRAPECTIYFREGLTSTEWAAGYTFGARIFTNSWGPALMENVYDNTGDTFMTSNAGALIIFAIGNDGPRTNTASGIGNGKLTIGVGAVENMRPVDFDSSDDPNQMASFSSRGPVADGRIKPDVVEIGTAVYSTCSDDSAEYLAGALYDPLNLINMDPDAAAGDYVSLQGTSMACPAVAGDAALVRDYLVDVQGIAAPHANLIKTLLIHGAVDMGLGYPSHDQGWGRVNVRNSVCPAFPNVLQWYQHNTGIASGTWSASTDGGLDTEVIDNTVPLKVTMSHWDSTTSGELVYDLDLVVTSPTGTRYEGNAFKEAWSTPCTGASQWGGTFTQFPSWVGGASYDYDEANDGGDDENNVEMFRIKYPEVGVWNIQVVWKESTARPFTIAITGGMAAGSDFNSPYYGIAGANYKVGMLLDTPRVVPERDDFGEGTFKCAPDGSVIVPYWINNAGTTDDTYSLSTPILPTGFTATLFPSSPVSVKSSVRLHGYARIMVGSAVAAGTYTLAIKTLSNNDGSAPIAQATIKFQIDVVTAKTPPTITVAGSPAHEAAPAFCSWGTGNIGCAYTQDSQYGESVYFTMSSDGGATWNTPIVVSPASWGPGYVGIAYMPSGTYAGRLMIAYNAWNPDGVGGNTADTRCAYIKVAYADSPYTAWTTNVNAFTLGEGRSVGNSYRTTNVIAHPATNAFMLVVEVFGYDATDLRTANMNDISCAYKVSTNGGGTWSAIGYVDTNGVNLYYFFPSVDRAPNGNIFVYFYERDAADTAQDRDASFREYNGAWGTYYVSWDTGDNLMFPAALATDEGTGNRRYGFYLKGADTDGDRKMYMHYSDTGTSWQTNGGAGWEMSSTIMSDHDYGTRFLLDAETSNGYEYVFGHQNVRYDPYGQPNMFVVYGSDLITARTQDFLTLDSYVHGKQRATATTHDATPKVFVGQNIMTKNAGHDIIGMHVYPNWQAATDIWGPVTEYVSADKTICNAGDLVTIVANTHEWTTGGNNICGASYRTDVLPAVWVTMQSLDGALNSPAEAVASSTTKVNTAGWSTGWHDIWVRGQDNSPAQNWGAETVVQIYVNPQIAAAATVTGPIGIGNAVNIDITYSWEGIPTSVNLYRTTQTAAPYTWTLIGNENPVDGTRPVTLPTGEGTYGFKASAVGGSSTENSPPGTTEAPEVVYTVDLTLPTAPTGLTVDNWGPDTEYGTLTTETRYLRGVAGEAVVNGLTAYSLGLTQSTTSGNWAPGNNVEVHLGMRVFSRSTGGVETEITSGLSATVDRTVAGNGFQTATWTPPQTNLNAGDSIVVKVYGDTTANPTTLRATFTTEQLGPIRLDAIEWTVQYWTRYGGIVQGGSDWFWGTATYDNNIAGFTYTPVTPRDPLQDNTLNWTASTSPDVESYNIYRADNVAGPYSVIDNVPVGTITYLDPLMGTADAILWWYHITAVDTATNEGPATANVIEEGGGPTPVTYDINITGRVAGDWVFVSFPIDITGDIETILNDGTTDWDVAKWFDSSSQRWMTHRKGATTNTFTTINNQMGVWVHLTAVGGNKLTTGLGGDYPASQVQIALSAGWNMVGYPSQTPMAANLALAGTGATIISVYIPATPYIQDFTDLSLVTMSHGNAYWVFVPAGITWDVPFP